MRHRFLTPIILAFSIFLLSGPSGGQAVAADPTPEPSLAVFRDLTPKEARVLATAEGKILLIRWTATWCGPCKRMDKTTWPQPAIVQWITDNAIAISADLDAQRRGAEVQKVNAVPTLIAFKDGKELNRTVGYQTADQLFPWLEALKDGRSSDQRLAAEIAALPTNGGEEEANARYTLAGRLVEAGMHEEAAEQYVWLWKNIGEQAPSLIGVRGSFMAGSMAMLAQQSPGCMGRFVALRDDLATRITPGPAFDAGAANDWITLNRKVLGDRKVVIAWAEQTSPPRELLSTEGDRCRSVGHELILMNRWDLAARWVEDPRALAHREIEIQRMAAEHRLAAEHRSAPDALSALNESILAVIQNSTRATLAEFHALALVKGADADAKAITDQSLVYDPSDDMRIALVQAALSANQVRQMHLDLLKTCPSATEFLRERVQAALTNPASPQTPPAAPPPSP